MTSWLRVIEQDNPALDAAVFGSSLKSLGTFSHWPALTTAFPFPSFLVAFVKLLLSESTVAESESNAAGTEEPPKSTMYKMQTHYEYISMNPTCASSCFSPDVNLLFICILQYIIITFKCAFPYLSGCTTFGSHNIFHISCPLCLIHHFRDTIIFCWHLHHFDS